jgi:putative SOS response-associated peptidase YedK
MVMVDAVPEMIEIHDRMPVILSPEDHEAWLHAPAEEALKLVRQYPAERLLINHTAEPWHAGRAKKEPAPTSATLL